MRPNKPNIKHDYYLDFSKNINQVFSDNTNPKN